MKSIWYVLLLSCFFIFTMADEKEKGEKGNEKLTSEIKEASNLLSYDAALAKAKKEKKSVFLLFTGRAWCGPCQELEKTVLNTKEFTTFINKKMVYTELDFPQEGGTEEQEKLARAYGIEGFPTIFITDETGKAFQRFMFTGQTTEMFIISIEGSLKNKALKDKFVASKSDKEREKIAEEFVKNRGDGENVYYYMDILALSIIKDKELKVEDKVNQLGDYFINTMDVDLQKLIAKELEKLDPENKLNTGRLFTIRALLDLIIANENDKAFAFAMENKAKFKGEDLGYLYQFAMQLKEVGKPKQAAEIIKYILTDDEVKKNAEATKNLSGLVDLLNGTEKESGKESKRPEADVKISIDEPANKEEIKIEVKQEEVPVKTPEKEEAPMK